MKEISKDKDRFSEPEFSFLIKVENNNKCADCDVDNPMWCSVNNGVFLCSVCARRHQTYDKKISYIKSIEADLWGKNELKLIVNSNSFIITDLKYRFQRRLRHRYKN